jgi:DNA processing protein
MSESEYWVGFANFPQVGPVRFGQLLSYFGSAKDAWGATETELTNAGLGRVLPKKFVAFRESFDLNEYFSELETLQIGVMTLLDDIYPVSLKQIEKPPFVLFYKGNLEILKQVQDDPRSHKASEGQVGSPRLNRGSVKNRFVAVVGTRMVTEYGRVVTKLFASNLSQAGIVVVSGLALGVDAIVHATTIDTGGKTIAVLGCGIACCYPSSNTPLYHEIVRSGGLILSEYSLRMSPSKGSFPARNRIIAGLSEAILVTEGGEDSGSIITAMEGLKYGKKVFAVPGPITSRLSKGPFSLVSQGGILVTSPEEMLEYLGTKLQRGKVTKIRGETEEEQKILDLLENEPMHFDELVRRVKMQSSKVGVLLSMMEMKGYIVTSSSGKYLLA